jgi:hypothetical protein
MIKKISQKRHHFNSKQKKKFNDKKSAKKSLFKNKNSKRGKFEIAKRGILETGNNHETVFSKERKRNVKRYKIT